MANLSLRDIENQLNKIFQNDSRKIVFWYDDKGEFFDDIEELNLHNGKIHFLTKTNVFRTKIILEIEDKDSHYLVYAPFPKPPTRENHLADTLAYSQEFFVDRASVLAKNLNIADDLKSTLKNHISFFRSRERENKFVNLEISNYTSETIELGIMSILSKAKSTDFNEILSILLSQENLNENEFLSEFEKYNLKSIFWNKIGNRFGYHDVDPSMEKFSVGIFLTYIFKYASKNYPRELENELFQHGNNVVAFLDYMKNNVQFSDAFNRLSDQVYKKLESVNFFDAFSIEDFITLDIFKKLDHKIIQWILSRLEEDNLTIKVNGMDIIEICNDREKRHFGQEFLDEYHVLKNAYRIISRKNFKAEESLTLIIENYIEEDYKIDKAYRKFYYYYDRLEDKKDFEDIREKVENIYKNLYLDPLSLKFTKQLSSPNAIEEISYDYKLQKNFYETFVKNFKSKLVVIISDGLRYEVGRDLVDILERDKKFDDIEIEAIIGVFPSITSHGMAALLPHREIVLTEDLQVLVDDKNVRKTEDRNKILKDNNEKSVAVTFNEINVMKRDEIREVFKNKEIIYIYHNQIDAIGDSAVTEDEVFKACEESINEIKSFIRKLTGMVSVTNYIVTADHGFVYKRDKMEEYDKISHNGKQGWLNKRFIFSNDAIEDVGIIDMEISSTVKNRGVVMGKTPMGSNIFKAPGSGQNYYHGGISIQEILVPVISVRTIKSAVDDEPATLELNSTYNRINGLIFSMEFFQKEAISDVVIPTAYEIYVEDQDRKIVSDTHIHTADNASPDALDRTFKLEFHLIQKSYNEKERYYLVSIERKSGFKKILRELTIDIPFAGKFGFDT